MRKTTQKISKKSGLPPGSLIYVGDKNGKTVITVSVLDYDADNIEEVEIFDIEECAAFRDKPTITWINIFGIHDTQIIEKIGRIFEIHPLVLEDILNTSHRPKIEVFGPNIEVS